LSSVIRLCTDRSTNTGDFAFGVRILTDVEIKCQLDATEVFIADLQHVSDTTMPIIRSSRVLYSGCCLWHFVLWFSSCRSGVELRVMCPVCRMLL